MHHRPHPPGFVETIKLQRHERWFDSSPTVLLSLLFNIVKQYNKLATASEQLTTSICQPVNRS